MPWRRGLQLAWQAVVWFGLALLCLLVLAWLTLQWGILPHIEDWRPAIERHASRAVGVPVRIGHISVRSSGWIPAFELRDVVLRDASGADALRLPRVSAALSASSFLVFAPRLSQLYIEDADLLVRRDAAGHLHIGGLDLAARSPATGAESGGTLDWFLSQPEFVLRHGAIRWVDEQRDAPMLALTDVDIVVRNGLRSHDMRIDATPPADWGDRFSLMARCRQPLFAKASDFQRWTGTVYADLPRGDVAQLKHHVDLPFELDGGRGALRLWLDFQNDQWRSATADVQLREVSVRLGDGIEPLAIAQAGGRLSAQRDPTGVALAAEHFGFETASGIVWPKGDLHFSWRQMQGSVVARHGQRWAAAHPGLRDPAASAIWPDQAPPPLIVAGASAPVTAPRLWDRDAPITGGQLSADHLDLALMRRLAAALPLPAAARDWLADYQPDGLVDGLSLQWNGPADAPATYRVNGAVTGFAMAASSVPAGARLGRPGWRNAAVNFDASEAGGVAHVKLDGGAIELPGVFADPVIPFDRFAATATWTIDPAKDPTQPPPIAVTVRDVHFENADAQGTLQLQWLTGGGMATLAPARTAPRGGAVAASGANPNFGRGRRFPGQIDLKGVLTHANAAKLARYLPLTVGDKTRDYIQQAFTSGTMDAVTFNVRGDLAGVPYGKLHDGDFRIAGHVAGIDLDYVPGALADDGTRAPSPWPAFTQVAGDIVLDRGALEIRNASGRMGELQLHDVHGGIATLYDAPALALQGEVAGPMTDFLRYVAQSPVGGWLHKGLAAATATGDATLDIALQIPLQKPNETTVTGALTLADNDVRFVPAAPLLANTHARFDFTEHGVSVAGAGARLVGGEASFEGGTQADGSLRFDAQGTASAEGLRRVADQPMLARLGASVNGQAAYKLRVDIAKGQTGFTLTSPLAGLGLALPAPLNKPADATWPLRVATTVSFDAQGRPRDTLRVDLAQPQGPLVQAEVLRDLSGPEPRPLQSAYAVGAPLPPLVPGGVLVLRGAAFDVDAWREFWRGLSDASPATVAATAPPAAASPPSAVAVAASPTGEPAPSYVPTAAALKTPDLLIGGRHLTNVDVQLAQVIAGGEIVWRSNVSSDQTKGVVEYRPGTPTRGAELFARLDRLSVDAHDAESGADAPSATPATTSPASTVPALDIVVDNFELSGKKLGKLEVAATLQAGARDWRLTKLALTTPEATLSGSGRWSDGPARRMALDFKLDLADSGAFLTRLGIAHALKGGKGSLSGSIAWAGSPLALDYPSLQGKLQIALDEGQFLKVDAGAGRLLGVLSLQSLPRRFSLDFRDLFDEGFAFDNITGDVLIDKGVATTKDLRMRSVSAAVLMSGRADLKSETQDLDVIVVPEINAGAASLAYAAINPVIGIGTFLAQLFLRSPLTEAGTREFHVTGTWSMPKVDQVEHEAAVAAAAEAAGRARAAKAVEDAAPAASAASAP